jgi:hypothetical protein
VNYTIHGNAVKYAIDGSNYIDICAVATHPFSRQKCTLSTDFVSLVAKTEKGYSLGYAIAKTTRDIVPSNISKGGFNWDLLTWDDYQPTGTKARYQVLYMNATEKFVEVEKSI